MTFMPTALKKLAKTVVAAATATAVALSGVGVAQAANRDWLRPGCHWDAHGHWVQRCAVWSPSMGRNIDVQIQPAQRGGNAAFYLLDGARAREAANAWTVDANAPAEYANHNITLVMPVGGGGSFYMDWYNDIPGSSGGPNFKWETFLTSELPVYLERHFGVSRTNNSIAGLSMGGTAALNLAARHPQMFRQAMSWSGYLTMTWPGMHTLLRLAMTDLGGFNINDMYGSVVSPHRFTNDPFWNMAGLRGKDIYISAANGMWTPADNGYRIDHRINGSVLEWFSRYSTTVWELKARAEGLNVTVDYPLGGIHSWVEWNSQLVKTKPRVLDVMNAW